MSTSTPPISESIQDYLKSIYKLRLDTDRVTTNALAGHLGVAAASVTGMAKKLGDVPAGETVRVERIHDKDSALLRRVAELGLRPPAELVVIRQSRRPAARPHAPFP